MLEISKKGTDFPKHSQLWNFKSCRSPRVSGQGPPATQPRGREGAYWTESRSPSPEICSLPYTILHPTGFPEAHPELAVSKLAEAQILKKEGKDSCAPRRAFQRDQTTPLWPWTQTLENVRRSGARRPSCASSQTVQLCHASSFIHEMMTDGSLDLQEGNRNREKWTDLIYILEIES